MAQSKIEWTEMTWNPTTGCTKVSEGCKNCYAEVMARRLQAMGNPKYTNGFNLTIHENAINIPYSWKSPKVIFVNSMSDLFHENIPLDFIKKVFKVMRENPQHVFQVLTKRSERLEELHKELLWTHNIWMGVTVENNFVIDRVDHLRITNARVKFVSCEPLLGKLNDLNLNNIDWVIVGGESGHNARPMKKDWVVDIKDKCNGANVPFFFKQWGGKRKKDSGRILDGKIYDEMPELEIG